MAELEYTEKAAMELEADQRKLLVVTVIAVPPVATAVLRSMVAVLADACILIILGVPDLVVQVLPAQSLLDGGTARSFLRIKIRLHTKYKIEDIKTKDHQNGEKSDIIDFTEIGAFRETITNPRN